MTAPRLSSAWARGLARSALFCAGFALAEGCGRTDLVTPQPRDGGPGQPGGDVDAPGAGGASDAGQSVREDSLADLPSDRRQATDTDADSLCTQGGCGPCRDWIDVDDPNSPRVGALASGGYHTCVLTQAGGVRCWGRNDYGQLGDGTHADRATPPAADVLADVQMVSAGLHHTCALMNSGKVRCWGRNDYGQLGDGTQENRATPPAADVLTDGKSVAAGGQHTCVLTQAGGVRC